MYAVITTGGKQYKVSEGDTVFIEKLDVAAEDAVTFDKVLAVGGETLTIGAPYVSGATVEGKVIKNGKSPKVMIFKYKSKKNERRRQGHRQPYTKVEIVKING